MLLMDMEQGADGDLVTLNRLKVPLVDAGEPGERICVGPKRHVETFQPCAKNDETQVDAQCVSGATRERKMTTLKPQRTCPKSRKAPPLPFGRAPMTTPRATSRRLS